MSSKKQAAAAVIICLGSFVFVAESRATAKQQAAVSAFSPQKEIQSSETRRRQLGYLRFLEARRLRSEAQRLRNTKLLEDAIKAYKDTIQLDPEAAEPRVDLGELYFFYLSRRDLAEKEAQEAVRLDPRSFEARLLMARIFVSYAKLENNSRAVYLEKAIVEYEKASELDPGHAESWALLAELYLMKRNVERQIHALEKWAAAPPPGDTSFYRWLMNAELTSDQAYYQLSQIYISQGLNQQAIEAARRAYELDLESNVYARNLIGILRSAATSAEELRIYSQLFKSANSPALLIGYGSALVRSGNYNDAAERLGEYVKLDPTNASAIGLLAIAQRRANRRAEAIETLKSGLARVDANTRIDLIIVLGEAYEEIARNEEAIAQYETAFETFLGKGALTPVNMPLFSEVVNRLVRVTRRTGNQAKLQRVLSRTRRVIDEHNSMLDLIMIEILREEGKTKESLDLAQASVRRYPEDRALKFTEALILNDLKRFGESIDQLKGMLKGEAEYATDDAGVYLILSSVQMQAGQIKPAEESARKSLELNPDDPDALIQLASVLDRSGRYDESEKLLRDLLQRDPGNATALNNLGYFMIERGTNYEEAFKLIERAIAIEPINGSFLDSLGWAHYKLGRLEKALQNLEKAQIYSKRSSTLHEHLGDVLRDLGRVAEARRQWEMALEYSIEDDETSRLRIKLKEGK